MSGRPEMITSMDDIWRKIPEDARMDWAMHQAAYDPRVRVTFDIFAIHDFDAATIDLVKDGLEKVLARDYGIPPERSPEVFGKAEALAWQEMESDGET